MEDSNNIKEKKANRKIEVTQRNKWLLLACRNTCSTNYIENNNQSDITSITITIKVSSPLPKNTLKKHYTTSAWSYIESYWSRLQEKVPKQNKNNTKAKKGKVVRPKKHQKGKKILIKPKKKKN